jgi:hypothetical protein
LTADFLKAKKNKKQQKYREWRMDMLRMDDLTQMRLMQKELSKMRKAKDKQKRALILAQSVQRKMQTQ